MFGHDVAFFLHRFHTTCEVPCAQLRTGGEAFTGPEFAESALARESHWAVVFERFSLKVVR